MKATQYKLYTIIHKIYKLKMYCEHKVMLWITYERDCLPEFPDRHTSLFNFQIKAFSVITQIYGFVCLNERKDSLSKFKGDPDRMSNSRAWTKRKIETKK